MQGQYTYNLCFGFYVYIYIYSTSALLQVNGCKIAGERFLATFEEMVKLILKKRRQFKLNVVFGLPIKWFFTHV